MEIVPLHKAPESGGSNIANGNNHTVARHAAQIALAEHNQNIAELTSLESYDGPRLYIFRKLRHKRELSKWLKRHGFDTPKFARGRIEHDKMRASQQENRSRESIDIILPYIRQGFERSDATAKKYGDELIRKYAGQAPFIEQCDTDMLPTDAQEPNLIAWLAHRPTDDEPYGATDDQLYHVLLWNAAHTESFAQNKEALKGFVDEHLANIQTRVAEDTLDERWADATPQISTIAVGDILEPAIYQDIKGSKLYGRYWRDNKQITIWPYEHDENEKDNLQHAVNHEAGHSFGGFYHAWLDESANEILTTVIEGGDPTDLKAYSIEGNALNALLARGTEPITYKELSVCFLGNDAEDNSRSLEATVRKAYGGFNALGACNAAYDEIMGNDSRHMNPIAADCAAYTAQFIASKFRDAYDNAAEAALLANMYQNMANDAKKPPLSIAFRHTAAFFTAMAGAAKARP